MAINFVLDDNVPDGTQITISQLDDHIKFHKRDVKERMDDSILDTGVTSWLTATTPKHMKRGSGRAHVTTAAAKPVDVAHSMDGTRAGLVRDQFWIRGDGDTPVTGQPSFQYYTGSVWAHIPIGADNILAGSITLAGLGSAVKPVLIAEKTDNGARTTSLTTWQAVENTNLSMTIAPAATTSLVYIYAVFSGGGETPPGERAGFRLRKTSGTAATVASVTVQHALAPSGNPFFSQMYLGGFLTGEASYTVRLEFVHSIGGGSRSARVDGSQTIDGEAILSRMRAIEFKA